MAGPSGTDWAHPGVQGAVAPPPAPLHAERAQPARPTHPVTGLLARAACARRRWARVPPYPGNPPPQPGLPSRGSPRRAPGTPQEPPMSTHALRTADVPMGLRVLRHLDLVVLVLALGLFLATGLPILGWAVAAAAWLAQRAISIWLERKARASNEPRAVAGLMVGSMLSRGWLVAFAIFGAGLSDH